MGRSARESFVRNNRSGLFDTKLPVWGHRVLLSRTKSLMERILFTLHKNPEIAFGKRRIRGIINRLPRTEHLCQCHGIRLLPTPLQRIPLLIYGCKLCALNLIIAVLPIQRNLIHEVLSSSDFTSSEFPLEFIHRCGTGTDKIKSRHRYL
jgi:hypothetical protein